MKKRTRDKLKRVFKPMRNCKHAERVYRYVGRTRWTYVITCANCYKVLSG